MKSLVCLILVLLVVGCGERELDATVFEVALEGFDERIVEQIVEQQNRVREAWAADDGELSQRLGELGEIYHAYELPVASVAYAGAARLDDEEPAWPYLNGRSLASRGELAAALDSLRAAAVLAEQLGTGSALPFFLALGDTALDVGRPEVAVEAFAAADRLEPNHPAVLGGRGRVALDLGELDEAQRFLERALAGDPRASALHNHLARLARLRGDVEAARHHAGLAGPGRPAVADPWMARLEARRTGVHNLMSQAQAALLDGRLEEARATYQAILLVDPERVDAWINLGGIEVRHGRLEAAHEAFEAALERDPSEPRAHFNLGVIALRAGRWQTARGFFEKTLELDPDFAGVRLNLALAQRGAGSLDQARELLGRHLEHEPDDALAHLWLAMMEMESHDYSAARDGLERGRELAPDPRLDHALARFLAVCPEDGLRDGQRAAELLPAEDAVVGVPLWELLRTRAMVTGELGRYEEAATHQRRAIAAATTESARLELVGELDLYEDRRPVRLESWSL